MELASIAGLQVPTLPINIAPPPTAVGLAFHWWGTKNPGGNKKPRECEAFVGWLVVNTPAIPHHREGPRDGVLAVPNNRDSRTKHRG